MLNAKRIRFEIRIFVVGRIRRQMFCSSFGFEFVLSVSERSLPQNEPSRVVVTEEQ